MKKTGVIGLGDMGSGLANNLLKAGYETWGFDLSSERNKVFADMGGKIASNPGEVGNEDFEAGFRININKFMELFN